MGRKISWCLGLTVLLLAGSGASAYAAGEADIETKAQFTGEQIEGGLEGSDVAEAVKNMLPGDSVTIKINLENQSGSHANWYMANAVSSLEDSRDTADGGAYTYDLRYTDAKGTETVIYNSESVGGENGSGEGLHAAVDSMNDYFYLVQLAPKETGAVWLTIGLDGESQGNGYQNTLANLKIHFAVETANQASGSQSSSGSGSSDGSGTLAGPSASAVYSPGSVQTGDPADTLLWFGVALLTGLALLVIAAAGYRREKGGKEYE